MEPNIGIIYILSNPAIPGLVKIGHTTQEDVKARMAQIYNTGVPLPFQCEYGAKVRDPAKVEAALHRAFTPNRVNPKREFFEIAPEQAVAIIRLVQIEDVTPQVAKQPDLTDAADLQAAEAYTKKRPRLSFEEMQIPVGATLVCKTNGETVTVKTPRTIEYKGEELSLTAATKLILENDYNVAPGPYWTYEGRSLHDIYNETYQQP